MFRVYGFRVSDFEPNGPLVKKARAYNPKPRTPNPRP